MSKTQNISFTTKNQLCLGCGICENVCPTHAIKIAVEKGEYRPQWDEEACLGDKCGRCLNVCPGKGEPLKQMTGETTDGDNVDKYIGNYCYTYTGYCNEHEIRYHSASGGMLTGFLIYLLEKGYIDGALVTRFSREDHITPEPFIARTKEELIEARSSKYCPVSMNKALSLVKEKEGRYVVVGVPCVIQGFRNLAKMNRIFRERVVGYFSIYCSSNRSFHARDFLLEQYQVKKEDVEYFAFRDNGCLGSMVIDAKGNIKKSEYHYYYGRLRSFFKPRRCLTCVDHYGMLADVNFGDIHIKPFSDDKIGISSVVTRTKKWDDLLRQARQDGYLTLDEIDAKTVNESQKVMLYPKKRRAKAAMALNRLCGYKNPEQDIDLGDVHPSVKDYLAEVSTNIQRFIGRHHGLWFLVKLSNLGK